MLKVVSGGKHSSKGVHKRDTGRDEVATTILIQPDAVGGMYKCSSDQSEAIVGADHLYQ